MTAAGGGLAAGLGQPAGAWADCVISSAAAVLGFAALWQQRGMVERRAKEMARLRRADLDALAAAEHRHRGELERVRTELEQEQQYSTLIQNQLTRAREQLERERAARRAAERELDAITGSDGWQPGAPSLVLAVEEPAASSGAAAGESGGDETTPGRPARPRPVTARQANAVARRRGWQVVDGDGADRGAEADRLYRPFVDQLAADAVPVSEAALAMAPVIGAGDLDGVLDLTAYDETVEFSVREIKDMA
ncbi:hypothetical protein KGA66_23905 [Actinocrinis puniceicyclus]|uniref:Uncharacterized protein n=1 Tax=Actinocrinis puniceicyclus TaxID=977794 RepID=A0A8J8BFE9_9ACTN|nr:hypothetical protein [Actinocrinis puniceicyclus]MBS2966111.1 hypothetical protein [Actinocrinis puniceicyclus]